MNMIKIGRLWRVTSSALTDFGQPTRTFVVATKPILAIQAAQARWEGKRDFGPNKEIESLENLGEVLMPDETELP